MECLSRVLNTWFETCFMSFFFRAYTGQISLMFYYSRENSHFSSKMLVWRLLSLFEMAWLNHWSLQLEGLRQGCPAPPKRHQAIEVPGFIGDDVDRLWYITCIYTYNNLQFTIVVHKSLAWAYIYICIYLFIFTHIIYGTPPPEIWDLPSAIFPGIF